MKIDGTKLNMVIIVDKDGKTVDCFEIRYISLEKHKDKTQQLIIAKK